MTAIKYLILCSCQCGVGLGVVFDDCRHRQCRYASTSSKLLVIIVGLDKLANMLSRTEQARAWIKGLSGEWTKFTISTGLNPHWVAKFAQGKIENPQAWRVDAVLEHKEKAIRRK